MWYIFWISVGPISSCVDMPANHSSSSSSFFFFLPLLPDTALRLAILGSMLYSAVPVQVEVGYWAGMVVVGNSSNAFSNFQFFSHAEFCAVQFSQFCVFLACVLRDSCAHKAAVREQVKDGEVRCQGIALSHEGWLQSAHCNWNGTPLGFCSCLPPSSSFLFLFYCYFLFPTYYFSHIHNIYWSFYPFSMSLKLFFCLRHLAYTQLLLDISSHNSLSRSHSLYSFTHFSHYLCNYHYSFSCSHSYPHVQNSLDILCLYPLRYYLSVLHKNLKLLIFEHREWKIMKWYQFLWLTWLLNWNLVALTKHWKICTKISFCGIQDKLVLHSPTFSHFC